MKKIAIMFALVLSLLFAGQGESYAKKNYKTWAEVAADMIVILDRSYEVYFNTGDAEKAKEIVNEAYFDYYEAIGFERHVKGKISGKRASLVEYQFAEVKRNMTKKLPKKEVRNSLDKLANMLKDDARALDKKAGHESTWSIFIASMLILVREGLEAMLVVAAIATYLVRCGYNSMVRTVYVSAIAAVIFSGAMAYALQGLLSSMSGANQEILEGATMLLAVVVLFFVSNWMVSKAEAEKWKSYIENKVSDAVTTGNAFALGAASFLAVFREGAETILFYQAMLAETKDHIEMVWYGMGAAVLVLMALFVVIRYGSAKLPLKPFFIGTSILMYIMSIAFAGGGVKELQEADVISVTPVPFVGTVDLLGIYPTLETLLPQAVLVVVAIACFLYYRRKPAA